MTNTAMRFIRSGALVAASLTLASAISAKAAIAQEVNIYSYRQPELIKPLLDAFTQQTGIKTNVLFLEKGLEERIQAEGQNSPADVILSVDVGRLDNAKEKGITQPVCGSGHRSQHPGSVS